MDARALILLPACVVLIFATCGAFYALYQLFGPILDEATTFVEDE